MSIWRTARRCKSLKAARSRIADDGPRQIQADQRYARPCLRRSVALRRCRAIDCLGRSAGLVARLSGDEFAIIIGGAAAVNRAKDLQNRFLLHSAMPAYRRRAPASRHRQHRSGNLSERLPHGGRTSRQCRSRAVSGQGCRARRHVFFDHAIRAEFEGRLALEADLARAAERVNSRCSISRRSASRRQIGRRGGPYPLAASRTRTGLAG